MGILIKEYMWGDLIKAQKELFKSILEELKTKTCVIGFLFNNPYLVPDDYENPQELYKHFYDWET